MSLESEITAAIHSHERWKTKLADSIEHGLASADLADVDKDDSCPFGRWLYGLTTPNGLTLPKFARLDPNYIVVQFLHGKFHQCAGQVVQLLAQGRTAEASALMAIDGEYTRTSDQLVAAMLKWKESVGAKSRATEPVDRLVE